MSSQVPTSSAEFLLQDQARTLFPMSLSDIMATHASQAVHDYIYNEILAPGNKTAAFLPQQRAHAAKARHHTRRTVKLDPVAEYFIYDLAYRNRAIFRKPHTDNRQHYGYRFEGGAPIGGTEAYSQFRVDTAFHNFVHKHALSFDIASYFNNIYHHDLAHWFAAQATSTSDSDAFSQFLREINSGRSIDCLPQGLYPCKMIGSAYLQFADTANRVRCAQMLRFMDDFHLFDDDASLLMADFYQLQLLLGDKGLSVNAQKTVLPHETGRQPAAVLDAIKIELLQKRRALMLHYDTTNEEDVAGHPALNLSDEQRGYLLDMLRTDLLAEEDAELVLALMHEHTSDLLDHLPVLAAGYPNLAKKFYQFCQRIDDKEYLANVLDNLIRTEKNLTEFQLFWFAKIAEDYLLRTSLVGRILLSLYEHEKATALSKARVLEIPENRFGMIELRDGHLRSGSSDWPSWAAAVGTRTQKKAQRNYLLAYFAKGSPLNFLIYNCISAFP